jgi:hypothetical protein
LASLFVAVVGISGLTVARITWLADRDLNEAALARTYAQSAIETGFLMINADSDWRNTRGTGYWVPTEPIGDGTMTLYGYYTAGVAGVSVDQLVLQGMGKQGAAIHRTQVTLVDQNGVIVIQPGSWKQAVWTTETIESGGTPAPIP